MNRECQFAVRQYRTHVSHMGNAQLRKLARRQMSNIHEHLLGPWWLAWGPRPVDRHRVLSHWGGVLSYQQRRAGFLLFPSAPGSRNTGPIAGFGSVLARPHACFAPGAVDAGSTFWSRGFALLAGLLMAIVR